MSNQFLRDVRNLLDTAQDAIDLLSQLRCHLNSMSKPQTKKARPEYYAALVRRCDEIIRNSDITPNVANRVVR
jgi:hypothetical protein